MTMMPAGGSPPTGSETRALTDATQRLTDTLVERFITRDEFHRHRRNVQMALAGAGLALLLLVASVAALAFVVDSTRDLTNGLEECTTPGTEADPHECYENSRDRTDEVVGAAVEDVSAVLEEGFEQVISEIRRQQ